jgi:hypothetical protein
MDEVIENLRRVNESVPVPLDLPTEEDLVDIEEQILLKLPADYRHFLLTVSDVVYGRFEPATAADPHAHNFLPELTVEAWENGLPRYLFPICQDDFRYYCMDSEGIISLWSQEGFADGEWESIWEWADRVWLGND